MFLLTYVYLFQSLGVTCVILQSNLFRVTGHYIRTKKRSWWQTDTMQCSRALNCSQSSWNIIFRGKQLTCIHVYAQRHQTAPLTAHKILVASSHAGKQACHATARSCQLLVQSCLEQGIRIGQL